MTKFLRAVCVVFCAVFLIISFAFATLNSVFYNKDIYENIVTDDYVEYMHDYIENALTYEAEYYQIEPDYFTDYINDSEIERYSKEYYLRVYAVLSGNKETEPTPFSSDEYKKGILEFEKRIEKDGYDFADEAVDEIAKEAAALSQTSCESISEKYLQAVGNITSNSKFKTIVKSYYIFFALATLFAILVFVIPKADKLNRLTLSFGSIFIPSMAVCVLMSLFSAFDFMQKLALGDIPLKKFTDAVIDKIMSFSVTSSAVIGVIFATGFIVCIVLRIIRINKNNKTE